MKIENSFSLIFVLAVSFLLIECQWVMAVAIPRYTIEKKSSQESQVSAAVPRESVEACSQEEFDKALPEIKAQQAIARVFEVINPLGFYGGIELDSYGDWDPKDIGSIEVGDEQACLMAHEVVDSFSKAVGYSLIYFGNRNGKGIVEGKEKQVIDKLNASLTRSGIVKMLESCNDSYDVGAVLFGYPNDNPLAVNNLSKKALDDLEELKDLFGQ